MEATCNARLPLWVGTAFRRIMLMLDWALTLRPSAVRPEIMMNVPSTGGDLARGKEEIMKPKAHGTCKCAVQSKLRWGCEWTMADNICCFNRHFAEPSGYYHSEGRTFVQAMVDSDGPVVFHDSVSGEPLFVAPIGRTAADFLKESYAHGWPSFRSEEVNWDHVRCLPDGEVVSTSGTHLGHNIPDDKGHRFCINLVSISGMPRVTHWTADTFRDAIRS